MYTSTQMKGNTRMSRLEGRGGEALRCLRGEETASLNECFNLVHGLRIRSDPILN